jgi:UDP-GlcNAc:undecaprenyl-phosphate GlcNAc-1-phosphate transferase
LPTILRIFISGALFVFLLTGGVRSFYFDSGLRWQYILLISFMGTIFFTPIARAAAARFGIVDKPDPRKAHQEATPLLGGLAVQASFAVALLVNNVFLPQMKVLLMGGTLIFLVGLWDDIRPLHAGFRFLLQVVVALFTIEAGGISLTFFSGAPWAPLVNVPLTALWIVGLTNAMNFFDGLDGLATGISIIIAAFFGTVAFLSNQPSMGWFAVALVGACLGFLPDNFRFRRSANIFLGDAGSTFLGFTLAGLAVLGRWSTVSAFVSISVPILILGVLIFDISYVTLSRIRNRKGDGLFRAVSRPGRDHLHHRLLRMGFLPKEAVFIILTLSTCFGVSALIIMDQNIIRALLGLVQALLVLGVFVVLMLKGRELDDSFER